VTLPSHLVEARELARKNLDYAAATLLTEQIRKVSGGSDMESEKK
jgi:hypothetical protein